MTPETQTSSINSLLIAVNALKRKDAGQKLSAPERAARVSTLIDRLSLYQAPSVALATLPIARSAEDR